MTPTITGIHHVTALTADGQRNIEFYTRVLGLRLVKVTVNFDDPRSYHLYYGDETGKPGTAITFFVWPGVRQGRHGATQVSATSLAVPAESLGFWRARLALFDVPCHDADRFGSEVLVFADPDGMQLEIVEDANDLRTPWREGDVPEEHAIRGFHGVTLMEEGYEHTAALLSGTLGFRTIGEDGHRVRMRVGEGPGSVVDLVCAPGAPRGLYGAGAVHHVAFRTPDDEAQKAWREALVRQRFNVSPIMDRMYFRSIYFREPGGVLFEVATEGSGFTIDEPVESLGTSLRLPAMHEPMREAIEAALPKLTLPSGAVLP